MFGSLFLDRAVHMAFIEDVVIVSAVRTPIGKFQGSLSDLTRAATGRHRGARGGEARGHRSQHVSTNASWATWCRAGLGQNPARQAALGGGLSDSVAAMTINKVCGSGLKAVALGQQAIQTGNSEIVVAGGMESMTNAPYLLPERTQGLSPGRSEGRRLHGARRPLGRLQRLPHGQHRRERRREVPHHARRAGRVRAESHRKAVAAIKECRFKDQIVPVELPAKKKGAAPQLFTKDESPREDTTIEVLRGAEAGLQEGRHGDGRQRSGSE